MITRRLLLAVPLIALPGAGAAPDETAPETLAAALAICWQARGTVFTPGQVAARIAGRTGKAALLAVAGAAISADGEEVETAVEIVMEAGGAFRVLVPLLSRDLARGLPAVALAADARWWLLLALNEDTASVRDPISGERRELAVKDIALIGRPVIAGA